MEANMLVLTAAQTSAAKLRGLLDLAEFVADTRDRAIVDLCHQLDVREHVLYQWSRMGVPEENQDLVVQLVERYQQVRDDVCPLPGSC